MFVSGYSKSGCINGYPVRSRYPDRDFFKLTLSGYNFNLNGSSGYNPLTYIIYPMFHHHQYSSEKKDYLMLCQAINSLALEEIMIHMLCGIVREKKIFGLSQFWILGSRILFGYKPANGPVSHPRRSRINPDGYPGL